MRLLSKNKLKNQYEFQRVFQKPKKFYGARCGLFVRMNDLGFARIGFIISKKRAKKAVTRNRIKRLVRESFRLHPSLKQQAVDIIFMAQNGIDKEEPSSIRDSLEKQWLKLIDFCKKQS